MHKLVTCIAAEDLAHKATQGLAVEFGIQAMVSYFARGFGRSAAASSGKLGQQTEKVIISVIVESKRVDDVFAYIFHTAKLDRPHGGIIYVTAINETIISDQVQVSDMEQVVE
ncbi:MAG: P-II family nitrogen regulator [Ghiorsea sp.]